MLKEFLEKLLGESSKRESSRSESSKREFSRRESLIYDLLDALRFVWHVKPPSSAVCSQFILAIYYSLSLNRSVRYLTNLHLVYAICSTLFLLLCGVAKVACLSLLKFVKRGVCKLPAAAANGAPSEEKKPPRWRSVCRHTPFTINKRLIRPLPVDSTWWRSLVSGETHQTGRLWDSVNLNAGVCRLRRPVWTRYYLVMDSAHLDGANDPIKLFQFGTTGHSPDLLESALEHELAFKFITFICK